MGADDAAPTATPTEEAIESLWSRTLKEPAGEAIGDGSGDAWQAAATGVMSEDRSRPLPSSRPLRAEAAGVVREDKSK